MKRKTVVALVGAVVVAVAVASAALAASSGPASSGPAVTVQIKSLSKTLKTAVVHGEQGWITKDGTPSGKCPGSSGAGALDAATHGKWTAKYYASYHDVLVTSILGVKPKGSDFWELFVDGKASSKGACEVKLKAHETILFKIAK
jgi:Domain of unknown function (DUF4430)